MQLNDDTKVPPGLLVAFVICTSLLVGMYTSDSHIFFLIQSLHFQIYYLICFFCSCSHARTNDQYVYITKCRSCFQSS